MVVRYQTTTYTSKHTQANSYTSKHIHEQTHTRANTYTSKHIHEQTHTYIKFGVNVHTVKCHQNNQFVYFPPKIIPSSKKV